ncbi:GNAT family N-acetyltransferase [Nocardia carnea]|uniref:GNAT family N-acetyltransferase n=1 Tax=Nocardia carnea TaxID=37328 RepID=UPI003D789976
MENRSAAAPVVIELRTEPYDSPSATAMIRAANRTNEALYGRADQSPLSPEEFSPEHRGRFLVAYVDEIPVGCGGYRRHHDDESGGTAEIKRMYVEADVRRQGIARALLSQLERGARGDGYDTIILDTGSKQHAAHALYECSGYRRTACFGIYRDKPGNRAYLKSLDSGGRTEG